MTGLPRQGNFLENTSTEETQTYKTPTPRMRFVYKIPILE